MLSRLGRGRATRGNVRLPGLGSSRLSLPLPPGWFAIFVQCVYIRDLFPCLVRVCRWTEFVCVGVVDVCWCVCMYVFMCACVCLCVYVRTYVCVSIWIYITGIARPALAWMLPRQYVGLVQPKRRRWEILFCGWPWRERACVFMSGLRSWSTGCTALLVLQMPQ